MENEGDLWVWRSLIGQITQNFEISKSKFEIFE